MTFEFPMPSDQTRWLRAGPAVMFAIAQVATVFADEGDGRLDRSASAAPVANAAAFNGTAYLKTTRTVLYADKPYGLARAAVQAGVDQCNKFREEGYHLPPVSPPEAEMAAVDVRIRQDYLDRDKALSAVSGHTLLLTDMRRWVSQMNPATGRKPDVPPDCAKFERGEIRNDTLWRDGLGYELRYQDHKAFPRRRNVPGPTQSMAEAFLNAPTSTQVGQTCREMVVDSSLPGGGHSCVWDLFPYVSHLNWPFVLSGRGQFGPMHEMVETIVPIEAQHGQPIPASVFEIPARFTVIGH